MKFVYDKSINQYLPEQYLNRVGASDIEIKVFSWLDSHPGVPISCNFSTRSIAHRFIAEFPQEFENSSLDEIRNAAAKWYNQNHEIADKAAPEGLQDVKGIFSADESLQVTNVRELSADDPRDKSLATRNGFVLDSFNKVYEYEDEYGDYHYSSIYPKNAVTEDCGGGTAGGAAGGACGAPGMGCGTSGIGGVADASANIGGVPATVGALEIPSPVLPNKAKKKKKGSSEALKQSADSATGESVEGEIPAENKNGDCFVQAFNAFYDNIARTPVLVHGIIEGNIPVDGKPTKLKYNHAWIEVGDTVIDRTIPLFANGFPKDAYYRLANIDEKLLFKYTSKDIADKVNVWQTYGPWEDILWQYP